MAATIVPLARQSALRLLAPAIYLEIVGMDAVLARVPPSYQRAIFARSVASGFVYRFGTEASFEDYRRYVEELARAV